MVLESKIIEYCQEEGFHLEEELAVSFKFRPDIVLKKTTVVRSFLIRKSNTIPIEFIERYSETLSIQEYQVEKYIGFTKKPTSQIVEKCSEYGVGISYISKGKLVLSLAEKKTPLPSLIPKTEVSYKMPEIHVFFASIQELVERSRGAEIIMEINRKYKKAIFATRIEKDNTNNEMTKEKLRNEIIDKINASDYFLAILTETMAEAVDLEVRHALSTKSFENIFLFVKNNTTTKKTWIDLLFHIEKRFEMYERTVWYYEYDDQSDFESELHKKIMVLLGKIHSRDGAKFL